MVNEALNITKSVMEAAMAKSMEKDLNSLLGILSGVLMTSDHFSSAILTGYDEATISIPAGEMYSSL